MVKSYSKQLETKGKQSGYTYKKKKQNFKPKNGQIYKKGHYVMIKELIHQEYVTIKNINVFNFESSKYLK